MSAKAPAGDRPTLVAWVMSTTLGWLLGFVLVVALSIAWDQLGGGAQFMVGVGMGTGVGLMQSRIVGAWVDNPPRWAWATAIGMGVPFLLWDLSSAAGLGAFFSLPACVVAGSLLVGLLQGRLLRPRLARRSTWIVASLIGWGLPVAVIALSDAGLLSGAGAGTVLYLGAMLLGGVVLGAVTGRVLPGPMAPKV